MADTPRAPDQARTALTLAIIALAFSTTAVALSIIAFVMAIGAG
ncbi:hypothetical protein HNR47_000591 [Methylopila jiangsuensis]|nr:hypothetical protein [Methylopila jiangsuensis]MDR6284608.1 hypothetical protein [Methylopila jiangsuensis]